MEKTILKKLIVYYFSGTGNSQKVALWILQEAKEMGIETVLINISNVDRLGIPAPASDALVAFVSPVHGFNYPPVMLHFIRRFPLGQNNVLLLNTRAGMLIGRWITPGLSGITFYLSALILKMKGYRIKAMYPVDLPSNWISVHPGLNTRTVYYLHEQNKIKVTAFARKVLAGGTNYRAFFEIIQDILVTPVSLGYYFIGRFLFAKTYFASRDCDNCEACVKNCPVKAIIKVDGRPFWTFHCENCMKCMSNCPKEAIETAHGSIIVYSIIYSSVILALLHKYIFLCFFPLENRIIGWIIESLLYIGLLTVWYRATHCLLRFKWFERIVAYTSLTKYKFWGRRYKAPKDI
jgi:Pyruvate/2-oxoacid:ferredoxin oxidoreductase delta subunit